MFGAHWIAVLEPATGSQRSDEDLRRQLLAAAGAHPWESTVSDVQVADPVHPADRMRVQRAIEGVLRGDTGYEFVCRLVRPDGSIEWIQERAQRATDSQHGPVRLIGLTQLITAQRRAACETPDLHDLTEAQRTATALARQAEEFATLANGIPTLCWMAEADGHIYWYNQRWYDYTGTTPEQMLGWGWQAVHDLNRLPEVLAGWQASIASGQPFEMTFPLRGADGHFRQFLTRVAPKHGGDGAVVRWLGTNMDVTEQVEQAERDHYLLALETRLRGAPSARAALTAACRQLGEALQASFVGFGEFDADGEYAMVESGWAPGGAWVPVGPHRFYEVGALRVEALRRGEMLIVNDVQSEASFATHGFRALIDAPLLRDGELRAVFRAVAAEARQWTKHETNLVRETLERAWHAAERVRAEEALRHSEGRARAIAEAMPQVVWTADCDGTPTYMNSQWEQYTGKIRNSQLGFGWLEALHPEDAEALRAQWQTAADGGPNPDIELRIRGADGLYRWFKNRALPIRAANDSIQEWIGTSTDITDVVNARQLLADHTEHLELLVDARTQELREAQARLVHAQRMEALGHLAGGVAHDFNNVLQAIQGAASLLKLRCGDPDGVARLAQLVAQAAERGSAITRRLLTLSRRADLRAEAVNAGGLLNNMREVFIHTLGAGIDVQVDVPPRLRPLRADRAQLETVLINLATNARDAMVGQGALVLAAHLEVLRTDTPLGAAANLRAGTYIRISVSDTGCGMSPDTLARASEPFFTTKPKGEGTGLGLAMTQAFAEQSGGGLHLQSAVGRGTTVSLWLPVAVGEEVTADTEDARPPPTTAATGRILVVDDDALVRDITVEEMRAAGYSVVAAESGSAALALLDAGTAVDLVITDLSMPEMDGLTLLRQIHRRQPRLPAILLTGFASAAVESALDESMNGAFTLLRKPTPSKLLAERVAVALEGARRNRAEGRPEPGAAGGLKSAQA